MEDRTCKKCSITKELTEENFRLAKTERGKGAYFKRTCCNCEREQAVRWRNNNLDRTKLAASNFFKNNSEYRQNWKAKNIDRVRNYIRNYEARTYVKLRKRLSRAISRSLYGNKFDSILNILPYSVDELRIHLERQFEPWMSWKNHGNYNPKIWNDNDESTWTWQIDHIIALASFDYKSMNDLAFQQAWALSNLRPLNAKQNIIDGACHKRIIKKVA